MTPRQLGRKLVLDIFGHPAVTRFMTRHGMRLGAARFVAGEDPASALRVAEDFLGRGIRVSLTCLGEYVADARAARAAADTYIGLLEAGAARGLPAGLSIKLTQLGLDLSAATCLENARRILAAARQAAALVEIDMEDSTRAGAILDAYQALVAEFPGLGVCLQAYLRRTPGDAQRLLGLHAAGTPVRVRLVKGAYVEPPEVAYAARPEIDRQYLTLARQLLDGGAFLAAATHDARLIQAVRAMAAERGLGDDRYEVQMLRGIHAGLQARLAAEKVPLRVLVVYGREWYPWFVRRLAERPANVGLLLRNLLIPSG